MNKHNHIGRSALIRRWCSVALFALLAQHLVVAPQQARAVDFIPVSVVITEVDDVGGGLEQGCCNQGPPDLYGVVVINGIVRETNRGPDDTSHIFPNWNVTVEVPAGQETVPIGIQIWDHDPWPGDDDLADTSPVIGDNILDLTLNLKTGRWGGESPWPEPCATGEADTRVRVCWAIHFPPHLDLQAGASSPTARAGEALTYTLTTSSIGDSAQASLHDALPPGLDYVQGSVTGGASYDEQTRSIVYNGPVDQLAPLVVTYRATVNERTPPGTLLENTPVVTGAGPEVRRTIPVRVGPSLFRGTLLLIFAAGDSLGAGSLGDAMLHLVHEAQHSAGNPNAITVVALDGPGENDSYLYYLQPAAPGTTACPTYEDQTCGGRYVMGSSVLPWGEDFGSPFGLTAFLDKAFSDYPDARQRIVVLAGHGGGWAPELLEGQPSGHATQPGQDPFGGMLWDAHPGQSLSTKELGQALRQTVQDTGHRIDLLYLDACQMAMAEVAYEVRDSADYLLASENTKWAIFPYAAHLASIDASSGPREIGAAWIHNEAVAIEAERPPHPYTFSLIDLGRLGALRAATDNLSAALRAVLATPGARLKISTAFSLTARFDSNIDGTIAPTDVYGKYGPITPADSYADLASFAFHLNQQFANNNAIVSAAHGVWELIGGEYGDNGLVITQTHSAALDWINPPWSWSALGGVSIYLPLAQDDWRRKEYSTIAFAREGTWGEFLNSWWSTDKLPPNITCPASGCTVPVVTDPPVVSHLILLPIVRR